jgi:hypothetical protein
MENRYRFTRPPRTLTRPDIQLDNFSLVTGNLSPFMNEYQALTNRQPKGTAVLVLPSPTSPLRFVFVAFARLLRENGKSVKLYSAT